MTAVEDDRGPAELFARFGVLLSRVPRELEDLEATQQAMARHATDSEIREHAISELVRELLDIGDAALTKVRHEAATDPQALSENLGPWLRELRTKWGAAQTLVAKYLEVPQPTLSRWELGAPVPTGAGVRIAEELLRLPDPEFHISDERLVALQSHDEPTDEAAPLPEPPWFRDLREVAVRVPRTRPTELREVAIAHLRHRPVSSSTLRLIIALMEDPSAAQSLMRVIVDDPFRLLRERLEPLSQEVSAN